MVFDILKSATEKYEQWLGITGKTNDQAIASAIDLGTYDINFNKKRKGLSVFFCTSSYLVSKYRKNLFNIHNELKIKTIVCGNIGNFSQDKIEKIIDKETNVFRNILLNHNIELGIDSSGDITVSSMVDMERMSFQPGTRRLAPALKEIILESVTNKKIGDDILNLIEKYAELYIDPFFMQDYIEKLISDKKLTKRKIRQLLEKLDGQ